MFNSTARAITRQIRRMRSSLAPQGLFGLARAPETLLIVPQDIRTADASIGADIYAGHLVFAGRTVFSRGQSLFDARAPAPAWSAELLGFAWMRHLKASGNAAIRAYARAVLVEWIQRGGSKINPIARWPRCGARRLISLLVHSPLFLEQADPAEYRAFMKTVAAEARLAESNCIASAGLPRLSCLIAIAFYVLCTEQSETAVARVTAALAQELDAQIAPDGMHAGRNPAVLIELLSDLLALRETYMRQRQALPDALAGATSRMMAALRCLRHSSGDVALFNGMGASPFDSLASLLAHGGRAASEDGLTGTGGYQRLEGGGDTVVIADAGMPTASPYSATAHAGTLGFEMSAAGHRLIINCGAPFAGHPAFAESARSTAAHSTLVAADTSSTRFRRETDALGQISLLIRQGPAEVTAQRQSNDDAVRLTMRHDGYLKPFGCIHERSLTLNRLTGELQGIDQLQASAKIAAPQSFALRFHLHPSLSVSADPAARRAALSGPAGHFEFAADGGAMSIDESVLFATPLGQQKTSQIVITARSDRIDTIRWSIGRRQGA